MPKCQVEILFPLAEVRDQPTQGWFIDGGSNQGYGAGPTAGTIAPGALPHQIGSTRLTPGNPTPIHDCCAGCCCTPNFFECIGTFHWGSNYVFDNSLSYGNQAATNQLDKFGNFYVNTNGKQLVFNPSGSVIAAMDQTDLANMIDAWFGSAIVGRGAGFNPNNSFNATPLLAGQYILAYFVGSDAPETSFAHWFAILQPSSTGNPTLLGAVWWESFEPFRLGYQNLATGIANNQTVNDPILIRAYNDNSGETSILGVIPSIADIAGGTYMAGGVYHLGWPNLSPCKIPTVYYQPIGNNNFTHDLYIETNAPNGNLQASFTLPDAAGGTNFYFYANRALMDFEGGVGVNRDPEFASVIQPANPLGAMIKISLGIINYVTVATQALNLHTDDTNGGSIGSTPMYTIDNANWIDAFNAPQIPFTDEYTYLSTGLAGGADVYTMQPGAVINRGDGIYWVAFYMPGLDDAVTNTSGTLHETVRLFVCNASTGRAVQVLKHTCILYTSSDIPNNIHGIGDYSQSFTITDDGGEGTISVNGFRSDSSGNVETVYSTEFLRFTT